MLFCLGGVSPFSLDEVWFVDVPSSGDRSEMCFFALPPVFRGLHVYREGPCTCQVQALFGATLSSPHWLSPWTDVPLWDGTWPL